MATSIRAVTEAEYAAYTQTVQTAFGNHAGADEVEGWRSITELDRTLAAFDGSQIVATAGAITFELSTVGGKMVRAAGVTAVGVLPTHRRRGLLTALMDRQLDDIAHRGEPVAILTASEGIIYGRFGYGPATFHRSVQIDPHHGQFAGAGNDGGRVDVIDLAAVAEKVARIHDFARLDQPGDIGRSKAWWTLNVADPEWLRRQAPPKFWACHVSDGGHPDGYVAYRVTPAWQHGIAGAQVDVEALVGLDPVAELALWRYVLDLDLTRRVVARSRPLDEALTWRLADPRQMVTTSLTDHVWARLLDVPQALMARSYGADGEVVLEVEDQFRPASGGRYLLQASGEHVECVSTRRTPDISLGIAELSSAYLGHSRLSLMARAGRVVEHTPGALRRTDLLFGGPTIPFCRSGF